ncbi:MAG: zinc ribbon domain-containing protein [Planctomycetota bacterium]|jgi:putative FmdB family regulatory protein|nr:zinc ribbon domain-containing protein [Planctomycetota bacterium]
MPTYEYECANCAHSFEEFQSMSDKPLRKCPQCGKNKLERLIGAGAGIIFKGSGFYETDYKRKSPPKPAEGKSDSGSSGDSSSPSSSSSSSEASASKAS